MYIEKSKMGLCRLRSCKYGNEQGVCSYSFYTGQTRTKAIMDMYGLPANSPELFELLRSHPCPLYERKKKAPHERRQPLTGQMKKKTYSCG